MKRLLWRIWRRLHPEMLYPNVEEYIKLSQNNSWAEFQAEFDALLKDYVGRPTPLFYTLIWKVQH
jgi:tryptophan synthase beta subunit